MAEKISEDPVHWGRKGTAVLAVSCNYDRFVNGFSCCVSFVVGQMALVWKGSSIGLVRTLLPSGNRYSLQISEPLSSSSSLMASYVLPSSILSSGLSSTVGWKRLRCAKTLLISRSILICCLTASLSRAVQPTPCRAATSCANTSRTSFVSSSPSSVASCALCEMDNKMSHFKSAIMGH